MPQPCCLSWTTHDRRSRPVQDLSIQPSVIARIRRNADENAPGKKYVLFPWPSSHIFPPKLPAGKGGPEGNRTVPPLAWRTPEKVQSERCAGFERGKMIDQGVCEAIRRLTSLEKAPLMVERPMTDDVEQVCHRWTRVVFPRKG